MKAVYIIMKKRDTVLLLWTAFSSLKEAKRQATASFPEGSYTIHRLEVQSGGAL